MNVRSMSGSTGTQALILAGGRGERLYPLTAFRPKPAIPFGGVFRIVDFTLSNCLNSKLAAARPRRLSAGDDDARTRIASVGQYRLARAGGKTEVGIGNGVPRLDRRMGRRHTRHSDDGWPYTVRRTLFRAGSAADPRACPAMHTDA